MSDNYRRALDRLLGDPEIQADIAPTKGWLEREMSKHRVTFQNARISIEGQGELAPASLSWVQEIPDDPPIVVPAEWTWEAEYTPADDFSRWVLERMLGLWEPPFPIVTPEGSRE